jgi:hypothetical protein
MHGRNNVNHVGSMPRNEVFTLKHPEMVARHEAFVRKVVGELKEFDNVYYEICNEPYERRTSLDWEARIARTIAEAERGLPARHMIAQNIANGSARINNPIPEVSLFNFHYAPGVAERPAEQGDRRRRRGSRDRRPPCPGAGRSCCRGCPQQPRLLVYPRP